MKAVIFDLDDTLYPEKSYCLSGYRAVADHIGGDYELLKELFIESPKMVFNRYFERLGINYEKEDILKLIGIYRGHKPEIEFFPEEPKYTFDEILPWKNANGSIAGDRNFSGAGKQA